MRFWHRPQSLDSLFSGLSRSVPNLCWSVGLFHPRHTTLYCPCWTSGSSCWYNSHVCQRPSGLNFVTWYINHFPSLSIILNLLQCAHPWSHHPNHWWKYRTTVDHWGTPLVTGLQLDIKPLIITHFNPNITAIFQAIFMCLTLSQPENKKPVGDGVKNVTKGRIYCIHHSLFMHIASHQ